MRNTQNEKSPQCLNYDGLGHIRLYLFSIPALFGAALLFVPCNTFFWWCTAFAFVCAALIPFVKLTTVIDLDTGEIRWQKGLLFAWRTTASAPLRRMSSIQLAGSNAIRWQSDQFLRQLPTSSGRYVLVIHIKKEKKPFILCVREDRAAAGVVAEHLASTLDFKESKPQGETRIWVPSSRSNRPS